MGELEKLGLFAPELLTPEHRVENFSCGKPGLDAWLRDNALVNQRENYTRTFVVRNGAFEVLAYYALCASALLRDDAPKALAKHGAPGQLPVVLLARLAVDRSLQGKGMGSVLVGHALQNAVISARNVASRAVVVDALDEQAVEFYRRLGFVETKNDPLKLVLPINDLIKSMEQALLQQ